MVQIGIIGIGFMGVTHFKAAREVSGARVAAICTRNARKLAGDWRDIKGNFGDSGGVQDLSGIAKYEDWRELLRDDAIDLVDICLPTPLHREVTLAALEAGKHVLVEKPIALSLDDADAMLAAAQKSGRLLMVAHVLRFFPAFAEARALVQSGDYGALRGVHLKRIISRPRWLADNDLEAVAAHGGPALDLHIHDTDFIRYLAGEPKSVRATGLVAANGAITYLQTQYLYGGTDAPAVSCHSGAIAQPALSFEHGFDIYLEKATLQYNNLFTGSELWIYEGDAPRRVLRPQRPDGFVAQLQHAVECVRTGEASELISGESARQSLALCLLEQQAVRTGEIVLV